QGQLPNALTPARTAPRHAYQVFSINSQRLSQLNSRPFNDSVAYAAVIGTNPRLDIPGNLTINPFQAFQPIARTLQPYCPWISEFNQGNTTDAIVPTWSASLGVPSHNFFVPVNHISLTTDARVQNQVRAWLNGVDGFGRLQPLPLGSAQ